jgi:hypothetical protein
MKKYSIELTPYQLLEFKYKALRELKNTESEEEELRYNSLSELLRVLEQAGNSLTVSLTQLQILRLAFLTLWDMEHVTEFDSSAPQYYGLFQTLETLGIVKEVQSDELGWLIPKVYRTKRKKHKSKNR